MSRRKQAVGKWGETLAEDYLRARGASLLERNARTPYGELDLVVLIGSSIVFVEVKARTSDAFGYPEEAVTAKKRAHLQEAAQAYLASHPELSGDWRIDVISIRGRPGGDQAEIEWFQNAIS